MPTWGGQDLSRIIRYIEQNCGSPMSLQTIAAIARMERTAFSRRFSRSMGMGFGKFLQVTRTQKAIVAMSRTDASLGEIAGQSGFGSITAFNRTFKKVMHETPSSYRRRLLKRLGL
jgi:transcriptional regulator GlxA family with amidase domain